MKQDRGQAGFSLLEVLIGASLFLVALMTIAVTFDSNRRSYARGEIQMDVQQNARLALGEMTREVRMAGFFPENFATPAADPALTNSIQIATESALAIYGDVDESGTSNVFLYCLDGTLLRRGRAPQGTTAAYWCPATDILAENVTAVRFTYYDEDNVPIPGTAGKLDDQDTGSVPDMSDVTERGAVRRVVISLTVENNLPGSGQQLYSLGSEVRLRNVE